MIQSPVPIPASETTQRHPTPGTPAGRIECAFTYHAPKGTQPARYERMRNEAKSLAYQIDTSCPESREKSLALTYLENAIMWANAAIARNE